MKHFIMIISICLFILIAFNPLKFKYDYDLMNNYFMKENANKNFTKKEILYVKENKQYYIIDAMFLQDIEFLLIVLLIISNTHYFIIKYKGVRNESMENDR